VHRNAPESLDRPLRTYEGCARAYLGAIDGANLIKLHRHFGAVSYLVYPDFETDPQSMLLRSVQLNLQTREIDCREFAGSANPPILHRKEAFLRPDDHLRAKFERLERLTDVSRTRGQPSPRGLKGRRNKAGRTGAQGRVRSKFS
jgi:DNA phosphorothioation-associated putative methyltransferase